MSDADQGSRTVLAFLNEVAGGRMLLERIREEVAGGAEHVALAAPQNQPVAGQIVDAGDVREAARSRVEVTRRVLSDFRITASAAVFDPDPALALDDAVRAYEPDLVLLSALPATLFGFGRKDLVEWARSRFPVPVEHVPVRIEDDAIRWDVTHALVVATQTVNAPDLVEHLIARHRERPHRYTFIAPRSGELSSVEAGDRLAATLAALYREGIDATGQPMSPEPFPAVQNGIAHYRVDEILISTFAGQESQWIKDGLLDRVAEITDKPVQHFESKGGNAGAGDPSRPVAAATSQGGES